MTAIQTSTANILPSLSDRAQRQIELTLGALCRAVRRAVRQAELPDRGPTPSPEPRESAWSLVNQRCTTLGQFLGVLKPIPQVQPQPEISMKESNPIIAVLEAEIQQLAEMPRTNRVQVFIAQGKMRQLSDRIQKEAPVHERERLLSMANAVELKV